MVRLDASETKQITHAIRMAACNAETILARALDGHDARAGTGVRAHPRGPSHPTGDIHPGPGQLLIRLDPLTAPRRTQAMAALRTGSTRPDAPIPAPIHLRYEVKPHPPCYAFVIVEQTAIVLPIRCMGRIIDGHTLPSTGSVGGIILRSNR